MTDALSKLPRFAWRGQEYPITSRSVRFAHDDTDHTFQYRDNSIIERKGAQNWVLSYGIPFRQDIAKGPYKDLFSVQLLNFIFACRDKSPDTLRDPVLGTLRAVVATYEEETDVLKRDGTDVRVEFKFSPKQEDVDLETIQGGLSGIGAIAGQSGALDAEVLRVIWPAQVPSPEPSSDPLLAVAGMFRQIENTGNKISAALDNVAYKAEQVEEAVSRLEDPRTFQLARSSRRVQVAALKAKERISNPERSLVQVTLAYTKSISSIARDTHMTVAELLRLNPTIAGRPLVKPGTKINAYKAP